MRPSIYLDNIRDDIRSWNHDVPSMSMVYATHPFSTVAPVWSAVRACFCCSRIQSDSLKWNASFVRKATLSQVLPPLTVGVYSRWKEFAL